MSNHPTPFVYPAKLQRVIDGDTVDAMVDLGFDTWIKARIRFYGVDTWECRTRDKEEKVKGFAAKAFTSKMLSEIGGGVFTLKSHGKGKFGRIIGELFIEGEEKSLNELLKDHGHAYEYYGGKRQKFTAGE